MVNTKFMISKVMRCQYYLLNHSVRRMRAIRAALNKPVTGSVTIHARIILRNMDQSTFSFDLKRPTKTMEPILQCVVLIGIPMFDATNTVKAEPISIQKPLKVNQDTIHKSYV